MQKTDLETCHNAGCSSVLILNHEDKEELVKSHAPHYVYKDCLHLQKELNKAIQQFEKLKTG